MDALVIAPDGDEVARLVADHCTRNGRSVVVLVPASAAELFTVAIRAGQATVAPAVPIFFRALASEGLRASQDEEFLAGEVLATIWTVAALTQAAVINRPSVRGFNGRFTGSPFVNERRSGITPRQEMHARRADDIPSRTFPVWVADLGSGCSFASPEVVSPSAFGPFRARQGFDDPGYETVVVVGPKAWRQSDAYLDDLSLCDKSIALCRNLQVDFALIFWYVSPDLRCAEVASIDPWPSFGQIEFCWRDVCDAIEGMLFQ